MESEVRNELRCLDVKMPYVQNTPQMDSIFGKTNQARLLGYW